MSQIPRDSLIGPGELNPSKGCVFMGERFHCALQAGGGRLLLLPNHR